MVLIHQANMSVYTVHISRGAWSVYIMNVGYTVSSSPPVPLSGVVGECRHSPVTLKCGGGKEVRQVSGVSAKPLRLFSPWRGYGSRVGRRIGMSRRDVCNVYWFCFPGATTCVRDSHVPAGAYLSLMCQGAVSVPCLSCC